MPPLKTREVENKRTSQKCGIIIRRETCLAPKGSDAVWSDKPPSEWEDEDNRHRKTPLRRFWHQLWHQTWTQESENRGNVLTTAASSSDANCSAEHPLPEMRKPRIDRGSEHDC